MCTVLVSWFSQAFKFFSYGIIITVTMITLNPKFDICNLETSYLYFLCKKTQDKLFLFCYTWRHSIGWMCFWRQLLKFGIFKLLWGSFPHRISHRKFCKFIIFSRNYMGNRWLLLLTAWKLMLAKTNIFASLAKRNVLEK